MKLKVLVGEIEFEEVSKPSDLYHFGFEIQKHSKYRIIRRDNIKLVELDIDFYARIYETECWGGYLKFYLGRKGKEPHYLLVICYVQRKLYKKGTGTIIKEVHGYKIIDDIHDVVSLVFDNYPKESDDNIILVGDE